MVSGDVCKMGSGKALMATLLTLVVVPCLYAVFFGVSAPASTLDEDDFIDDEDNFWKSIDSLLSAGDSTADYTLDLDLDSIVFAPMVEYPSFREDAISIFEGKKVNYNLDFLSVLNPDDIDVDLLANLVNTYIESLFTLCFETNFPKKNLAIDLRFKRFMYHCHERISSYIISRESYSTVSLIEWLRYGYVPDQIDYFSLISSTMPELEQVYDPSMPSVFGVTNHLVIDSCELAGMNVQHLVSVTIPLVALYNQYKSEKLKPMFILNEHLGTPKQENICSLISRHFKQKGISYIHVVNGAKNKNGIFSLYATNHVYETIHETSFNNDYQEIVLKEKFAV